MKAKIFTLLSLSILTLVFCMSLASAVDLNPITVSTIPTNVSQNAGSFNIAFNLTNIGTAGTLDFNASTVTSGATIVFDDTTIADGSVTPVTETITATVSFPSTMTGTISGLINVTGTLMTTSETLPFSVLIIVPSTTTEPEEITECALTGDNGNLRISIKDIKNDGISDKKFGDDTEWFPLENIEVEIEVENKGDEKIKNIAVGWGLYDIDNEDWIIDDEESDFDLKDGKDEVLTINFQLDDVNDFENGNDYVFYVWATGEDQEFDPEQETCVSDSDSIDMILESDFVVVDNIEFPDVVQCGAEIQVTADVWNIGDDNQDEVSVQIYDKTLGINKMIEIGDIDAFEDERLDTIITIPKETSEGWYSLTFYVNDEDGGIYENDYDDDKAEFRVSIHVEGSCLVDEPKAVVSAILESGGKAGEELVVKATVTNTGDELASYVLTADDYSEWASLLNIEPSTIVLNKGDSKEVMITLNVNNDVFGEKLFYVVATSDGEEVLKQPVSVTIQESASGFSGITGNFFSGESSGYLWGIAILNIILVIVIIVVVIRVSKR